MAKWISSLIRNPQPLNRHQLVVMPKRNDELVLLMCHNYSWSAVTRIRTTVVTFGEPGYKHGSESKKTTEIRLYYMSRHISALKSPLIYLISSDIASRRSICLI